MTFKQFAALATVSLATTMTGCASIISDDSYPVSLQSNPSGASFMVTDQDGIVVHSGNTPATVTLSSGAGYFSGAKYTVSFQKPGHNMSTITIDSTLDGWYIGNLLFGGLIGMLIVDPATGAMWKLPKAASAQLGQKLGANETDSKLQIVTLDEVPADLHDQLTRLN